MAPHYPTVPFERPTPGTTYHIAALDGVRAYSIAHGPCTPHNTGWHIGGRVILPAGGVAWAGTGWVMKPGTDLAAQWPTHTLIRIIPTVTTAATILAAQCAATTAAGQWATSGTAHPTLAAAIHAAAPALRVREGWPTAPGVGRVDTVELHLGGEVALAVPVPYTWRGHQRRVQGVAGVVCGLYGLAPAAVPMVGVD